MGYAHWLSPWLNGNHVDSIRRGKCKKRWAQQKAYEHTMACRGRLKGDKKGRLKTFDSRERGSFRIWEMLQSCSEWKGRCWKLEEKTRACPGRKCSSKALIFQLSNDLAPFIAEVCGCWKPDPAKWGWLCIIVQLINVTLLELKHIFMLTALRNDSTDSHSDFRSSPQALSLKL